MKKYLWTLLVMGIVLVLPHPGLAQGSSGSLRFYGNGTNDIDRVKIRLDNPARAVDVGGNFTIEFFMRVNAGENNSDGCTIGNATWITGNIIIDRDIFGSGDYGDYGVSLFGETGTIAFGVNRMASGNTLCGTTNVVDGEWHHIAVTRNATSGLLALYVDGVFDTSITGPTGDVSYRDGRTTGWPNSDPFLVIGAEKHDVGAAYPAYSGWVDELRISNVVRYTSDFSIPTQAFVADGNTVGLYHFDEGSGNTVNDSSGTNSQGVRRFGGSPQGPQWSDETPFVVPDNFPPMAVITAPKEGGVYQAGQTLSFAANGWDTEDGSLPASAFSWQIVFHHDAHTHPFLGPIEDITRGSFTIPRAGHIETNVWYRIHLSVTDSSGFSYQTYRDVYPRLATITLRTNPPGLPITFDGQTFTSPLTFTGVAGVTRSVAVLPSYTVNGIDWTFAAWSDRGAIAHEFNTPASNQSLTATYRASNTISQNTTPTFHWDALEGATRYQIQIDDDRRFGSPDQEATVNGVTRYSASPLPSAQYYWRVRAVAPEESNWVMGRTFTVDVIDPLPPTLLTPEDGSTLADVRPTFRWQPQPGDDAIRYELQLSTNPTPDVTVQQSAARSYRPPSPLLPTSYYWRVRAFDAAGNSSDWTAIATLTLQTPSALLPSLHHFVSSPQVLTWTAVSWAARYQLQIDNHPNFASPEYEAEAIAAGVTSHSVVMPDGSWYWRVRAIQADGRPGRWSEPQLFSVYVP